VFFLLGMLSRMTSRRIILHESTQRSLCRLGFVLLGLAPLLLCGYLSIAACIPGYHRRQAAKWEKELEKTFGLTFRIGEAHELAPIRFRLDNVEVSHPETQKLIGKVRSIHLESGANDSWNIRLETPQLELDQIAAGSRLFHQFYVSRGQSIHQRTTIQSDGMLINDGNHPLDLSALSIQVLPDVDRWELSASFKISTAPVKQLVNLQPTQQCALTIRKHPAATDLGLTIPSPFQLPCSALAKLLELTKADSPLAGNLVAQSSQFSGAFYAKFHDQKVDYHLANATISQIDMGRLSRGTESLLSGVGKLTIITAELSSTQLERASGYLELGPGHIDSRFLQSLGTYLGFALPRQQPLGLVGFNRTLLRFAIQPKSIKIDGGLEDGHGVLALRTDESALPIISLVHALAFNPQNPSIPSRISPLVRQALVWLPLDEDQRQQLASRQQSASLH
jgi:hypothetical protein